MEVKLYNFCL